MTERPNNTRHIDDDPTARAHVAGDIARLSVTLPNQCVITDDELRQFHDTRAYSITPEHYSDGRSKADVATKLGVSATLLSKVLHGRTVLDVGCGIGTFAADIAKDKSIRVTALDNDSANLDKVPEQRNITVMEGNGYDLLGSGLEPESFDAVFVTYSTNFWANSAEEVALSLTEPLKVLKPNGSVFVTPIAQNLGVVDASLREQMGLFGERLRPYHKVVGYHAIVGYSVLSKLEENGLVSTAFRASSKNAEFKKRLLADGSLVAPDSYSVIMSRTR